MYSKSAMIPDINFGCGIQKPTIEEINLAACLLQHIRFLFNDVVSHHSGNTCSLDVGIRSRISLLNVKRSAKFSKQEV
jgi:hypothetical protein